jgi:hypothetical protein
MPSKHSRARRLPIATQQVSRSLIRLHCHLRGEVSKKTSRANALASPKKAKALMNHIEALLEFFGVDFDPSLLPVRRSVPKVGPLDHGGLRRGILAALREKDWMSYQEIAEEIKRRNGLELNVARHRHFVQKLREASHVLLHENVLEREKSIEFGDHTQTQRLRLSRTLYRTR